MNTPQEKAKELFIKYNEFDFNTIVNSTQRTKAKECALIAVEEILQLFTQNSYDSRCEFYVEVKEQIKLL